jgi:transcriptional regulator with XRE-family HTH domain
MSNAYRTASVTTRCLLAAHLKHLRAARGYAQAHLGARAHLHKNYVSSVEQGTLNITLAHLEALATGLDGAPHLLLQPAAPGQFPPIQTPTQRP